MFGGMLGSLGAVVIEDLASIWQLALGIGRFLLLPFSLEFPQTPLWSPSAAAPVRFLRLAAKSDAEGFVTGRSGEHNMPLMFCRLRRSFVGPPTRPVAELHFGLPRSSGHRGLRLDLATCFRPRPLLATDTAFGPRVSPETAVEPKCGCARTRPEACCKKRCGGFCYREEWRA